MALLSKKAFLEGFDDYDAALKPDPVSRAFFNKRGFNAGPVSIVTRAP